MPYRVGCPPSSVRRAAPAILLLGALLSLPGGAGAQDEPLWCAPGQDPLSGPYPAPTWSQIQAVPNYDKVMTNFRIAQSLRLLVSALEKGLAELGSAQSLASVPDVDGTCLCDCGRDAAAWAELLATTIETEVTETLEDVQDQYLDDVQGEIDAAHKTVVEAVPTFEKDLEKIVKDLCAKTSTCDKDAVEALGKQLSEVARKEVETIFQGELDKFESILTGPGGAKERLQKLRQRVEDLGQTISGAGPQPAAVLKALLSEIGAILGELQAIVDDSVAQAKDLAAAYTTADLEKWGEQVVEAVETKLVEILGNDEKALEQARQRIEEKVKERIAAIKAAAQSVYDTATDLQTPLDRFKQGVKDGVLADLESVDGCYGKTKRDECTVARFCEGTKEDGDLFGQPLPMWFPTEAFRDGKTALLWALETVDWLEKVKKLLADSAPPKLMAGGAKLLDVLKDGQKLLDDLSRYVDTFTTGFHLGAYSSIRPDLHACVGYAGHETLAQLVAFDIFDKHIRGGAIYLSANLVEDHRVQFRSGGFGLNINGHSLPLVPGVSLNLQADGFRFWDRFHPFGLGGDQPGWSLDPARADQYDVFNLVTPEQLTEKCCGNPTDNDCILCPITASSLFYVPYYPIDYKAGAETRTWPRPGVEWENTTPVTAVLGAGLNLDLQSKKYRWETAPIPIVPGVTVTPWMALQAGASWTYEANHLRQTLLDSINKNLPKEAQLAQTGFNRDQHALQAPDVTEDVGHGANVNPELGADLLLGVNLGRWLKIGVTASLYVGADVKAGGFGGVLDLNRSLVETLADSNPKGNRCEPIIDDNATRVCSNTFAQKPGACKEGEKDCIDLSPSPPADRIYSTGTYVCGGEGEACEKKGYCKKDGKITLHDTTRELCEAGEVLLPIQPLAPGALVEPVFFPEVGSFFPYQCVDSVRPKVTGYKGVDCPPLEYGYPSACPAGTSCACDPDGPPSCAAGRTCVEGACLETCGTCAAGYKCDGGACVLENGVPFAEQIAWRMKKVDAPQHAVASYALDKLVTSVVAGVGVKVGLEYKLFRKWKEKTLLDFKKSFPLLTKPLVTHQLGLEARYQDDCADPAVGELENYQPDLIKRPPDFLETSADLIAWCKPAMAADVKNPAAPQEIEDVIHAGLNDTFQFGLDMGEDSWRRAQLCVNDVPWDTFLKDLERNPAGVWPLLDCAYTHKGARQALDCSGPAALQNSLITALGCLDTAGPGALTDTILLAALLDQDGLESQWLLPGRSALDPSKVLIDDEAESPFAWWNVDLSLLEYNGRVPKGGIQPFLASRWLAALDACIDDAPGGRFRDDQLEVDFDLDEDAFQPCGGACCADGDCTEVANQDDCGGSFSPGLTCGDVDAASCLSAPSAQTPGGACFVLGECRDVFTEKECIGSPFLAGAKCSDLPTLCAEDGDCPADSWCARKLDGSRQCVPFSEEGGGCGEFSLASRRCKPGLTCVITDPNVPDLGGTCQRSCVQPARELVAWWPFDEAKGPTAGDVLALHDGRHVAGPLPVPGTVGRALRFDGIDDSVEIPDAPELDFGQGDFSIVTWIQTSPQSGTRSILDKRSSGAGYRGYHLFLWRGHPGLQLADGTYTNFTASPVIADGKWHHLAVTVDRDSADGLRWYLDGEPVGLPRDPTAHSGSLNNGSPLKLAVRSFAANGWWRGALDELALYDRSLTAGELKALFTAGPLGQCKPLKSPIGFYTIPPCRILNAETVGSRQNFRISPKCGIPEGADAVSLNINVLSPTGPGHLVLWPAGLERPLASTIPFGTGRTRTNNAILGLAPDGTLAAEALVVGGGSVELSLDANGYFISTPPACQTDQECALGSVCETTVLGICNSPSRECVPGCRYGQRGCAGNLLCTDQVCKTCPCPDLCMEP